MELARFRGLRALRSAAATKLWNKFPGGSDVNISQHFIARFKLLYFKTHTLTFPDFILLGTSSSVVLTLKKTIVSIY